MSGKRTKLSSGASSSKNNTSNKELEAIWRMITNILIILQIHGLDLINLISIPAAKELASNSNWKQELARIRSAMISAVNPPKQSPENQLSQLASTLTNTISQQIEKQANAFAEVERRQNQFQENSTRQINNFMQSVTSQMQAIQPPPQAAQSSSSKGKKAAKKPAGDGEMN